MYSEKKLAYFETVYRETKLSKPQDVNVTVTAEHLYGVAYICEQTGTKEEDPVYTRFSCRLDEITKIYINNNNRMNPIYIQCDNNIRGVISRKRIVLPCFNNSEAIVKIISDAKAEADKKLEQQREKEKNQKLKEIEARRKAMDDDFERMTSGYKDMIKPKAAADAEAKPAVEEPKPAPAPVPAETRAEPKPAPAPAPAPVTETRTAPKPAPAPAPVAEPQSSGGSITVEDILGLDDILGITPVVPANEFVMDALEDIPNEEELDAIPEEIVQKDPDEIEGISAPVEVPDEIEPSREEKKVEGFAELDTNAEIAKKLTSKSPKAAPAPEPVEEEEADEIKEEPKPVEAEEETESAEEEVKAAEAEEKAEPAEAEEESAPVVAEIKEEPKSEPKIMEKLSVVPETKGSDMSLDDFETAVKKLKTMLDNGVITESEFAVEKKKLLKNLY